MTSPSTITERVAEMRATMAAQPPSEAMGAFAREQAELAAAACRPASPRPGPFCPTRSCSTCTGRPPRCTPPPGTARRSWSSTGAPGARTATSPCPPTRAAAPAARRARHPARRDQPAEAGRVADHAAEAQPGLHRRLRPRQHHRRAASASSPGHRRRPVPPSCSSDSTWPASTPTAPSPCRCPPPSSSTPAALSAGSTSTPTTAPAPSPGKSSTPSTSSRTDQRRLGSARKGPYTLAGRPPVTSSRTRVQFNPQALTPGYDPARLACFQPAVSPAGKTPSREAAGCDARVSGNRGFATGGGCRSSC